jgi:hypothetical protein
MNLGINIDYFLKQPYQLILVIEKQFVSCKSGTEFLKYCLDELMLQSAETGPSRKLEPYILKLWNVIADTYTMKASKDH